MSENTNTNVMDMSFFMPGKIEEVQEVQEIISSRFKDGKGKPIPFIFRPISTERVDEIEKMCMRPVKRNGKTLGRELDQSRFMGRLAVETTVYPDFKAEDMRKAYKTEDALEIAKKVLSVPGEYAEWISKVSEVNGFDDEELDLEEEAKN